MNDAIDTDHPVFLPFRAAGYPPEALTDPADVAAEDIETGEWRVVRLTSHGIEMFDVDGDDIVETGRDEPYDTAVEFGSLEVQQPIGFGDESGPLNERLNVNDAEVLRTDHSLKVPFFTDDLPREPSLSRREAVEALSWWGSEGHVPRTAAEAMLDAFDAGYLAERAYSDDPDVDGGEIVRPDYLAAWLVGETDREKQSEDDGITGHKKRRRQKFYRNLDVLKEVVGIDE